MPTSLAVQAENMFGHVKSIVEAAGGTMDSIVKINVLMKDATQRGAMNELWLRLFPDENSRPARQTAQADLEGGSLIQCDFWAVIG